MISYLVYQQLNYSWHLHCQRKPYLRLLQQQLRQPPLHPSYPATAFVRVEQLEKKQKENIFFVIQINWFTSPPLGVKYNHFSCHKPNISANDNIDNGFDDVSLSRSSLNHDIGRPTVFEWIAWRNLCILHNWLHHNDVPRHDRCTLNIIQCSSRYLSWRQPEPNLHLHFFPLHFLFARLSFDKILGGPRWPPLLPTHR